MRSTLARIIAFAALIPLASATWSFIDLARQTYRWDGLAVPRETFTQLSDGVVTPVLLFGVAAIVEMLFRIAERAPTPNAEIRSHAVRLKPWPWRSMIANLLLIAAALTVIASVWSTLDFVNATASLPDTPKEQIPSMLVRGIVDAVIAALWVVGLAAAVEYLSRIATTAPSSNEKPT